MRLAVGIIVTLSLVAGLVVRDFRKNLRLPVFSKRAPRPLQAFLPFERFHESGAMVVRGKFRRQIRVGDLNLYSMPLQDIVLMRDRFKDMLKRMDEPFAISVQARRKNDADFIKHAKTVIDMTVDLYQSSIFTNYAALLFEHVRQESLKPRTDRENLIVVGVLPKLGGESEASQLERLEREIGYIQSGLHQTGLRYRVQSEIEQAEAIQNFWNRDRAVSQRYRDAWQKNMHAPTVVGAEVEAQDVATLVQKTEENHRV